MKTILSIATAFMLAVTLVTPAPAMEGQANRSFYFAASLSL